MAAKNMVRHFYRVRVQGLPDLSSFIRYPRESPRGREGVVAHAIPVGVGGAGSFRCVPGVPRARFCLIEFIVSSDLTLCGTAANGGPLFRSIELPAVRRDG